VRSKPRVQATGNASAGRQRTGKSGREPKPAHFAVTAVAHLAGAIGKPFWLLNRSNTCRPWLLDRDDSPWYPTARLPPAVAGRPGFGNRRRLPRSCSRGPKGDANPPVKGGGFQVVSPRP
jgi:hypothetical protein